MQDELERPDAVPGFVGSLQTFGSYGLNWYPHVHGIVSEGVFAEGGSFHGVWELDEADLEERFRRGVIDSLRRAERLSDDFAERLLEWEHSGFSVHVGRRLSPVEPRLSEHTGRYIARPISVP
jgi:hypothetical protein